MSRDESRRSKRARADRDFEMNPGSAILMNDFDDERTLDEEEALEASEDTHNELSHLQKESDMPLKDLLVMYGYGDMSCQDPKAEDEDDEDEDEEEDEEDDEDEDEDDPATYEPDLKQFYTEMVKAEENGASVTRPASDKGEAVISAEATSLGPNANALTTPANVEAKAEEGGSASTGNLPNDSQPGEVGSSNDNLNSAGSALGPAAGVGGGSGGSSRLLRSVSRPQSEEEEDDCDYSPDEEEWKKTIMVGSDYQAAIPEGLCKYDDALPYENVDKMLWDPYPISEQQVEEFLSRAQLPVVKTGANLPVGHHARDDEQALYLLLQCGYNLEEALRRRRMNVLPAGETVSLWSEEECHNFESGLRNYGKDFHLIQKNKVRTRSVGELVQFYYLWKKTERHDIFTCKARLEKKKYALHPGVTDYMDRFLDEQEGVRDRSSSPNVHCLLYGDAKRQRTTAPSVISDDTKADDLSTSTTTTTSITTSTTSSETTLTSTVTTTTTVSTTINTPVNISIIPIPEPMSTEPQPQQHHHHNLHNQALDLAKPVEPSWPSRNHLHYHDEEQQRQQPTANEQPP